MPSSLATCISGRTLLYNSATVSCLNSDGNSRLFFVIAAHFLHEPGLAKVSTKLRDH